MSQYGGQMGALLAMVGGGRPAENWRPDAVAISLEQRESEGYRDRGRDEKSGAPKGFLDAERDALAYAKKSLGMEADGSDFRWTLRSQDAKCSGMSELLGASAGALFAIAIQKLLLSE